MNNLPDVDPKDLKIEFAPGCFDSFEGTQEELDELIAEVTRMVRTGEIFEKGHTIDLDDLDDEDVEIIEHLSALDDNLKNRKLQ